MSTNAVAQNPGILCTVKETAINSVNWCGTQISNGWQGFKTLVAKIGEYVRPFFANLINFIKDGGIKLKDFAMDNKAIVGTALAACAVTIAAVLCLQALTTKSSDGSEASKQKA